MKEEQRGQNDGSLPDVQIFDGYVSEDMQEKPRKKLRRNMIKVVMSRNGIVMNNAMR